MIAEATEQQPDYSNVSFMMIHNHVIRCGPQLEIYNDGEIKTLCDYDRIIWMVMNYLNLEGFLDKQPCAIENTFVFDCNEHQIDREELEQNEAI